MDSVFFLVLRRMRAPIIAIIVIYAISVFGLTLIPGVDPEGRSAPPMSFFHAFYFVSYTATTIGFGEIPVAFSDAQRLWVTLCIYLTVVGWSYSVVTLIALLQDQGFQNTLTTHRFARRVKRQHAPFYIVCGCGETGGLIARHFDRAGQAFVVLEKDALRVEELDLQDFQTDTPALAADASVPEHLLLAGLQHPQCVGVLAVTSDEQANLAIAIAVRLLNPAARVVARVRTPAIAANMASFGTHHIINAFERFADHLALAVSAPARFRLMEILTGLPGTPLPAPHRPPQGPWILCGYGRFGHALESRLLRSGITLRIIDPNARPGDAERIPGDGTEAATLVEAGIETATGIIAGSDNDVNNLAIAVTAAALNPELFVVVRQNISANSPLFQAYAADFSMVPSRIIAQECIALLTAPLLARFFDALAQCDEPFSHALAARIEQTCVGVTPIVWEVRLNGSDAPTVQEALRRHEPIRLGDLLRDGTDRDCSLPLVPLLMVRDGTTRLTPTTEVELADGDELLFAGPLEIRRALAFTLQNANEFDYVVHGRTESGSWLWRHLRPAASAQRGR